MIVNISDCFTEFRAGTTVKRQGQLFAVARLFGSSDTIDTSIFNDQLLPTLKKWFKTKEFSQNTQKSYLSTLCVFGEKHNIPHSCQLAMKKTLDVIVPVSKTEVLDDYMDKLDSCLGKNRNLDIIIHTVKLVGAIRLHELINTRIDRDDGVHNYLDMDKGHWYFRSAATKNNKERDFAVSKEYIKELRLLLPMGAPALLLGKEYMPYTSTASLATLIKKHTGMNYQTIRKSRVATDNQEKNMDHVANSALIHGHKISTEMVDYSKPTKKLTIKTGRPVRTKVPKDVEVVEIAKIKPIVRKRF